MAVVPGSIPVIPVGKALDTTIVETSEGPVHREGVYNASPSNPDARQEVDEISQSARTTLYSIDGHHISVNSIGDVHALVVHSEDIDTQLVNLLFHELSGTTFTLASAITAGDTSIEVVDATGLSVGNRIEITEDNKFQKTLPVITVISTNTLTLDGPIDASYTTSAMVEIVAVNMAVVGSLASPKIYRMQPHGSEIWHLTRMNFSMIHKTAATDDKFGGLAALVNGVVLRSHTSLLGTRTLTNWKSNQHFREDMFDVEYSDKAGPSLFGTAGRWSFKQRTDTVIRLDGAQGDYTDILIQDDLTASSNEISEFQIKMQGHIDEIPE